jgi:hypothetical protein
MNKLVKFLTKYWIVLSVTATILTSLITGIIHLKGRIDNLINRIDALEKFVKEDDDLLNDHDSRLDSHEKQLNELETLKELWEKGLLKGESK